MDDDVFFYNCFFLNIVNLLKFLILFQIILLTLGPVTFAIFMFNKTKTYILISKL